MVKTPTDYEERRDYLAEIRIFKDRMQRDKADAALMGGIIGFTAGATFMFVFILAIFAYINS